MTRKETLYSIISKLEAKIEKLESDNKALEKQVSGYKLTEYKRKVKIKHLKVA